MAEYVLPEPVVDVSQVQELARDLVVIPNRNVGLVPNIGVIGGIDAVLVIDTGMGRPTPRRCSRSRPTTPEAASCT